MANSNFIYTASDFINPTPVDQTDGDFIWTQSAGIMNITDVATSASAVNTPTNFLYVFGGS